MAPARRILHRLADAVGSRAWNEQFIDELCSLPGEHDDVADSVSQGFNFLAGAAVDDVDAEPSVATYVNAYDAAGV